MICCYVNINAVAFSVRKTRNLSRTRWFVAVSHSLSLAPTRGKLLAAKHLSIELRVSENSGVEQTVHTMSAKARYKPKSSLAHIERWCFYSTKQPLRRRRFSTYNFCETQEHGMLLHRLFSRAIIFTSRYMPTTPPSSQPPLPLERTHDPPPDVVTAQEKFLRLS